jgi:hypothetical protein
MTQQARPGARGLLLGSSSLPTPSPPAEKTTACQDQAGKPGTRDGTRNWLSINEVIHNDQVQTPDFVRPQSCIAICYPDAAHFG